MLLTKKNISSLSSDQAWLWNCSKQLLLRSVDPRRKPVIEGTAQIQTVTLAPKLAFKDNLAHAHGEADCSGNVSLEYRSKQDIKNDLYARLLRQPPAAGFVPEFYAYMASRLRLARTVTDFD